MSKRLGDLTGDRYGRLTVVKRGLDIVLKSGAKRPVWICVCSCGAQIAVRSNAFRSGNTRSCGCISLERIVAQGKANATHGESNSGGRRSATPEHRTWIAIKKRCSTDPARNDFKNYGSRGITVCQRWLESYDNFLRDMGRRPSAGHSIDRINNDGNYEPSNCRWATRSEQQRNKRPRLRMVK